jgi:small GTP-binding protein
MEKIKEIKQKILLLGDGAVGKTSLIKRFVLDQFDDKYIVTIGAKVSKKLIHVRIYKDIGMDIKLMIWDVIGQHGYSSVHASSFVGTDGVLMVYDVNRPETLTNLKDFWIPSLEKVIGKVPMIFLGNKSDLEKLTLESKENEIVSEQNSRVLFTSAKTGDNVELAFLELGRKLMKTNIDKKSAPTIPESKKDISTPVELADIIISEFCDIFGGVEYAMPVVKYQFERTGMDPNNPTLETLNVVINNLIEVLSHFKSSGELTNLKKRWVDHLDRVK